MVITFIIDSYDEASNGIATSTKRFAKKLAEFGHAIQIVAASAPKEPKIVSYNLGISKVPILYQVSKSQGFTFAKCNKKLIKEAIKKSDIVHCLVPFKIERYAKKICDKYNIPSSAAFHLQPENITSTIYLNKYDAVNKYIYKKFRKFYNKFEHVHCPSNMIKGQLVENGYTSKLHVISNGVCNSFKKKDVIKKEEWKNKFVILMIARLSEEKRQDLIIEAVKHSKHEKDIQIVFAGKGPIKMHLEKMGEDLTNPISFGFYTESELIDVINMADLYVHASDAEIEAIGCMEAFTCGVVPVISDSILSATNQFALDDLNLFRHGDYESLAQKIDYWFENPSAKEVRSLEYIEYAKKYNINNTAKELEEMFYEAIKDSKKHK